MSDIRLSATTKAVLSAAKAEAPSLTARANMWAGVSGTLGTAAGAGGIASALGGTSAKMLVFGTLLGGTATVGLALALLRFAAAPAIPARSDRPVATASAVRAGPDPIGHDLRAGLSSGGAAGAGSAVPTLLPKPDSVASVALASGPAKPYRPSHRRATPPDDDPLTREALLVSEARTALAHGDARLALETIRAARGLSSRQLVPEELAVEAQALRSLGRSAEARDVGALLDARYPGSALAR